MSAFRPMTNDDLIELAPLDALGLLEKNDAAMFERAFLSASPEVQRRIRDIQASYASDPLLMSPEEPPADLDARVISGVMSEIRRSTEELAPLAVIGPGSAARNLDRRRGSTFGSAMLWRAASFVLLAGLVTSLTFYSKTVDSYDRLAGEMYANELSNAIHRELGSAYFDLIGGSSIRQALASPTEAGIVGGVAVNANRTTAVVYAIGLATAGHEYRVEVIDGDTNTILATEDLHFSGVISAAKINFQPGQAQAFARAKFRVLDETNAVVLTSDFTIAT